MRWFLELNLPTQLLLLYFLLINSISFFYIGIDKMKAQLTRQRVSEKTLWLLSLIGGSLGTLLGMNFFRHKTKKISFQAILAVILAAQIFLILLAV
ncbi:MAG: hypothetical protein A2921_02195 [Candidatus Magasanikbacteria bacterium RIFCSPLOWO2_01_FULL_43_20b]|uniref:DUF1294 domain-containing protein n=1 Tax=Candidatus Magasanikbacteria bacterium RIFCSPLOWO2_12_FULL_43_12 TaxID=1798692 RepID=A0A1F6MQE7_9BACT|nr:MAG: hypothetical protein A3C74_00520 [Candidatus Magasanikbacteria bacterium RIFCSPHIGHO2_02_FULL_44_13]OGH72316.1 MAG: hypothetical protein A3I93_04480 [Candidatus Magasanikbacteria bacterium RIFCSPLOWO2_02_FULL_43_22]OGH73400.1 MAG: hypothetical protein A2921_02195 [Candidatus Magasanikbacteria bacterium RIFCSPLOWO2_01_FULL_43_20b]OGH73895.1 MAG: hypothetical protein A3G00_01640 [Candidatus Magasanikbacteria bacterium RIFCSPLOWO2_12_FULL_43_12]